jgi:hypothetical protein
VRGTFTHLRRTTVSVSIRPRRAAKVIGLKIRRAGAEEDGVGTAFLSVVVGAGAVLLVWFVLSTLDEVLDVAHGRRTRR